MTVRVRLFASLRDAAGTAHTTADASHLHGVLDELAARYGEPFRSRLGHASIVLDGDPVDRHHDLLLPEGCEVALLPPFAGGSSGDSRGGSR